MDVKWESSIEGEEVATGREEAVDPGLAWLAAVTVAALTLLAIALLAKPLGRLLFPVETAEFWPSALALVNPRPTQEAGYLLALLGAILVPCCVLYLRHRPRPEVPRGLVLVLQLVFVGVLALGIFCRRGSVHIDLSYFNLPTIVVALAIGAGFTIVLSRPALLTRVAAILAYRPAWLRWVALGVAAVVTAIWLLPAIQLDTTVAHAQPLSLYELLFTFDEGLSVFNHHSPLVDYVAQYGSLWPYVIAVPMHIDHGTLGDYTISIATITLVAMLAIYGVVRRLVEGPIAALVLFLAFMATSFFVVRGTPVHRYSFADYFGIFPLRYAMPFFVFYFLARHLDGERPRRAVWVFMVAGLAVLNNGDFGIPALGATVVAVVAATGVTRDRRWWAKLAAEGLIGLLGAFVLVSIVTLARTGELPNISLAFRYAHLFALAGYNLLPLPWFGTWVTIYLTYCAALAVAALLVTRRGAAKIEIGALAWIGIFGLGIGSYYSGRSDSEVLIAMFPAWGLAIIFLSVVSIRDLVRRGGRPGPAQVALFVGFGLMVCSLAQFPAPWHSIKRLERKEIEVFRAPADAEFIAAHTKPGEPVALLTELGQRISDESGVDDVTPYSGVLSMPTRGQLTETLDRLRDEHGTKIFLRENGSTWPELLPALKAHGFRVTAVRKPTPEEGGVPGDRSLMLSDVP